MSIRSRGIVLQAIKYSDSSLIAKIFTETSGLQSYLVKGVYGRKSKYRSALFQPMTLVDFVGSNRPNKDLHFLTEIGLELPYSNIPFNMQKNAVILFISELLTKTIREEEANTALFGFIHRSMEWLDLCHGKFADFPLYFFLELSRYLGFYPKPDVRRNLPVFDLLNGQFFSEVPSHTYFVTAPLSEYLTHLCNCQLENIDSLAFSNKHRRQLLAVLIDYYKLHVPGFSGMQSQDILRTVME